jgi:predicted DNA-binding protein YlxM (UPF0122 family)
MVKNPGWENKSDENWISQFESLLEMAEEKAQARQRIIDNIKAMKIAGISKDEASLAIVSELIQAGAGAYCAIYSRYLNEVYDEVKESTT